MAIATATNLEAHAGGRRLFSDVSFKLEARDRMTLAGRNGAGKTTLLRVLAGEQVASSGSVALARGARLALHDQRPPRAGDVSLGDYVLSGRPEMLATEEELEELERSMSAGADERTMSAYAAAQQRFEAAGGYRWRDEALTVLSGLGFTRDDRARALPTFSGGELTRASLARALATRPDLLLLDEPTNHLDIPTLEWLESHLVELDAAVVLVAHDRWFLEAVGTSVLELEAGRGRFFAGPWHAWRTEQAAREIALGKQIDKQQAEIARMERFVERFRYKASKARQAQSKLKAIERIKRDGPKQDPRDRLSLRFSFAEPERTGRFVLKMQEARIEVPGRVLLDNADLKLERGEHAVLVGPNGSGKTTLLETLAGLREPAAGSVRTGHNVKVGYLSQHAESAAGEGTVLSAAIRETGLSARKARDLLGGFLFSGSDVDKGLDQISGGEQRRLSLAILVASDANVLILDEPTNHLDLDAREALEDALLAFRGAVLVVSHDRALLEAVGTRTLVCERGELRSHPVGWAAYERDRAEERAAEKAARPSSQRKGERRKPRKAGPSKNALRRIADLERSIEEAEQALRALEDELADPDAWSSPGRAERASERHLAAKRELEELYATWEEAAQGAEPASTASE
jgi:ATP-binding cassette, subfamily F, member 3